MHMTGILTIIAAATYGTTASAKCWKPSADGDHYTALNSLDVICTGMVGSKTGNFQSIERRTQCIADLQKDVKWDFTIENQKKDNNPIEHKTCVENFKQEVERCHAGGHHSASNFNFIVAASKGNCQAPYMAVDSFNS